MPYRLSLLLILTTLSCGSLEAVFETHKGCIAGDYAMVMDEETNSVITILKFPSLEIVKEIGYGFSAEHPTYRPKWILGSVGSEFLLLLSDGGSTIIVRYDPVTEKVTPKASHEGVYNYHFKWKNLHLMQLWHTGNFLIYNETTEALTLSTTKYIDLSVTYPDENGYFWHIETSDEDDGRSATKLKLTESGIIGTGIESDLSREDLQLRYRPYLDALGVDYFAAAGSIYNISTAKRVTTYPTDTIYYQNRTIYDLENSTILYSAERGKVVCLRSMDGSRLIKYRIPKAGCDTIIKTDTEYLVFYSQVVQDQKKWNMVRIPRGVPPTLNRYFPDSIAPGNIFKKSGLWRFVPIDDTRTAIWEWNGANYKLVLIDTVKMEITASLLIEGPEALIPYYLESSNSLLINGYELSLREEDLHSMNWKFAMPYNQRRVFYMDGSLYYANTYRYDTVEEVVYNSNHMELEEAWRSPPIKTPTGEILYLTDWEAFKWGSEGALRLNNYREIPVPTDFSIPWKVTADKSVMATNKGTIYHDLDFNNPITIVPFSNGDRDNTKHFALSEEKFFRLSMDGPFREDYFLRSWNFDGSQVNSVPLDGSQYARYLDSKYKTNWMMGESGGRIFVLGGYDNCEIFLYEVDKASGELLVPEDPAASRLTYKGWYKSSKYGWIYDSSENWKYAIGSGWNLISEGDGSYIEWHPFYGFIWVPGFRSDVFYSFERSWRQFIEERDGYNFYWNYEYKYEESDYPAYAPLHLQKRKMRIMDGSAVLETWTISNQNEANVYIADGFFSIKLNFQINYEGPSEAGDNTVRIVLQPNDYGVEGYYELTFNDYNQGLVRSNLSMPDPDNPNKVIYQSQSATFKIIRP